MFFYVLTYTGIKYIMILRSKVPKPFKLVCIGFETFVRPNTEK